MPKAKVWSPGPGLWIVYYGPVAYRFFDTWREAMECAVGPLGRVEPESHIILSVN